MRIQIIGINYTPEKTGIAPYTAGLARHLSERHDVTVITSVPHYPDWRVAPADRVWRRDDREGSLRVVRLNHYVPCDPTVVSRAAFEATFAARAAAAAVRIPADLVLTVVPALLSAHAARAVAQLHGAPLGVIVQDVMGRAAAQTGMKGGKLVSRLASGLEKSALRAADSVSTIHPRLADELAKYTGHRPRVIYNWTHVTTRPRPGMSLRRRLGWGDDEIVALHSGNMGAKQNLEVVVDAARLAEREGRPIRFVLAGGGNQRARLETYARGCGRLSFMDSVEDDDYMDLLASADVLLVNERPGMNEMSLPSKLTSYLVAGRPIVAATDPHSGTAGFVRDSGGGVLTPAGDHGALVDAIGKIAADDTLGHRLADAGRAFAGQHLTPAGAMAAYDSWIDDLVAEGRGSPRAARQSVRRATSKGTYSLASAWWSTNHR